MNKITFGKRNRKKEPLFYLFKNPKDAQKGVGYWGTG